MGDISLQDRITRLFATALNLEVPSPDTDLFDTGALDSLALVELLLQLEQEFGVTTAVEDLEVQNFSSIRRIAAFVAAQTDAASAPRGRVFALRARG
jgi:acyl carrier protein